MNIKGKYDLLWTYTGGATFNAQTIRLSLSDYPLIGIQVVNDKNDSGAYQYNIVAVDGTKYTISVINPGGYMRIKRRACTATATGVTFGEGYDGSSWDNHSVINTFCIPLKIYGIKI